MPSTFTVLPSSDTLSERPPQEKKPPFLPALTRETTRVSPSFSILASEKSPPLVSTFTDVCGAVL